MLLPGPLWGVAIWGQLSDAPLGSVSKPLLPPVPGNLQLWTYHMPYSQGGVVFKSKSSLLAFGNHLSYPMQRPAYYSVADSPSKPINSEMGLLVCITSMAVGCHITGWHQGPGWVGNLSSGDEVAIFPHLPFLSSTWFSFCHFFLFLFSIFVFFFYTIVFF